MEHCKQQTLCRTKGFSCTMYSRRNVFPAMSHHSPHTSPLAISLPNFCFSRPKTILSSLSSFQNPTYPSCTSCNQCPFRLHVEIVIPRSFNTIELSHVCSCDLKSPMSSVSSSYLFSLFRRSSSVSSLMFVKRCHSVQPFSFFQFAIHAPTIAADSCAETFSALLFSLPLTDYRG